eukprot:5973-Heterococcus_DN1.PRE.3
MLVTIPGTAQLDVALALATAIGDSARCLVYCAVTESATATTAIALATGTDATGLSSYAAVICDLLTVSRSVSEITTLMTQLHDADIVQADEMTAAASADADESACYDANDDVVDDLSSHTQTAVATLESNFQYSYLHMLQYYQNYQHTELKLASMHCNSYYYQLQHEKHKCLTTIGVLELRLLQLKHVEYWLEL